MTIRSMIESVAKLTEDFEGEVKPEELMMEPASDEGSEEGDFGDIEQQVVQFFMENPSPEDDALHAFAESLGIEPDELETRVYAIFSSFLSGGKSQGNDDFGPDEEQLAMGIEVEKEHTDRDFLARKIALDHLKEIPDYYTRLKKMEDEAKGESVKEAREKSREYKAGAHDFKTGKKREDNPFSPHTTGWKGWELGYEHAKTGVAKYNPSQPGFYALLKQAQAESDAEEDRN